MCQPKSREALELDAHLSDIDGVPDFLRSQICHAEGSTIVGW